MIEVGFEPTPPDRLEIREKTHYNENMLLRTAPKFRGTQLYDRHELYDRNSLKDLETDDGFWLQKRHNSNRTDSIDSINDGTH